MIRLPNKEIEQIIIEMLQADPNHINNEIAREVNRRLGTMITKRTISTIRNKIGLGNIKIVVVRQLFRKELQK